MFAVFGRAKLMDRHQPRWILEDPARSNIAWQDIDAMFEATGAEPPGGINNSRWDFNFGSFLLSQPTLPYGRRLCHTVRGAVGSFGQGLDQTEFGQVQKL